MLVSQAKAELNQFDDDDHIGVMIVTADEVHEICGTIYRKTNEILDLLSRRVDRHFWYNKREIFPQLISEAYGVVERRRLEDAMEQSNKTLQEELGLDTLIISVDHEVRPMHVFNVDEPIEVESLFFRDTFTLEAGATYADLLTELDKRLLESGDHHVFYEGLTMNAKRDRMGIAFGS